MSIRCRFGIHRWADVSDGWTRSWACARCNKPAKTCTNCGGQHDPTVMVQICTVVSGRAAVEK